MNWRVCGAISAGWVAVCALSFMGVLPSWGKIDGAMLIIAASMLGAAWSR